MLKLRTLHPEITCCLRGAHYLEVLGEGRFVTGGRDGATIYSEKDETERKGRQTTNAVSFTFHILYPSLAPARPAGISLTCVYSGLDNAGKTTIVKKFLGEDITTISPTFGFNIRTVEHKGWVHGSRLLYNILYFLFHFQTQSKYMGCGRSKVTQIVLEELF